MGIIEKLEEVRLMNKFKKRTNCSVLCQYRFTELQLVAIKTYMDTQDITNETQAVKELVVRNSVDAIANGD